MPPSSPEAPLPRPIPTKSPWPRMIVLGFVLVVAINVLFIYIAVSGADPVVASYTSEPR